MVNNKREWLRYLHEFLLNKFDEKSRSVRDLLYRSDYEIKHLDCTTIFKNFTHYTDLMDLDSFIRNSKIEKILYDK